MLVYFNKLNLLTCILNCFVLIQEMKDLDEKKGKRRKGSAFDDDTEEASGVRKRLKGNNNRGKGNKHKSFKRKA